MSLKEKKAVKRCKVGGQAVIEGVMMKSDAGIALAVRNAEGEIITEYSEFQSKTKRGGVLGWPILRGVTVFVESLTIGMRTLSSSANVYGEGFDEEPTKFEKFLADKLGKSIESVITGFAAVLAVIMALGLFFALPLLAGSLVFSGATSVWRPLLEGAVRLVIFLGYILLCAQLNDIKRVFMYHGAEHKTIACYEAGDPLVPEEIMKHKRLHPRCGTNYMFLVMAISIVFFTVFDVIIPFHPVGVLGYLFRLGTRLFLLPAVAGVSYEVLQLAAKSDGIIARIIRAPGMGLQFITTKEPTADMVEVALASFKLAMQSIGENLEIPCAVCDSGDSGAQAPAEEELPAAEEGAENTDA